MALAVALQPFCPPPGTGTFRPPSGRHPIAAYAPPFPAAAPAYAPAYPAYPAPAYPNPVPLPAPTEPNRSSQVFQLPDQPVEADPIRKRGERSFPTGMLLVAFGALLVVGILGYATYRLFLSEDASVPEPFTNTQGMKMVKLDGGTFRMGSPDGEPARRPDEGPTREVTVRGPLFVSAFEVTNGQFLKVYGSNPSRGANKAARADHLPVDSVTWDEAAEFCRKLTEKEKGQPWWRKGWEYRLPTEAEWEYACRAGTDGPTAFGPKLDHLSQGVYAVTPGDPVGVGVDPATAKPLAFPQEVGKTEPNKFGLYDMHGNVAEWCRDWYRSEAYKDAAKDNPTGPADGDKRVVRGGSFNAPAAAARSAAREGRRPNERFVNVGFRVVYAPIAK
jgi:formylglycine-generating enzyme required for sulfatase activity